MKARTKKLIEQNINHPEHGRQIELPLNRHKQLICLIHGGGNIGLGLMAHILEGSPYRAIATSNNTFISNLINTSNQLWLQHDPDNVNDVTCVNNITMIPRTSSELDFGQNSQLKII